MAPAAIAAGKHLQKYNEFPRSEASPKLPPCQRRELIRASREFGAKPIRAPRI